MLLDDIVPVEVLDPIDDNGLREIDELWNEETYFTKLKRDNLKHKGIIRKKKVAKNYINNEEFKVAMLEYHELNQNKSTKKVTDRLWTMFMLLANNVIRLPYFNRRPDKEDMIMNAVIKCVEKVDSFDMSRESPFAYFTTVVMNSFWHSRKTANSMYYGDKNCYQDGVLNSFATGETDEDCFEYVKEGAMYYE